jgi:hypothetical protein
LTTPRLIDNPPPATAAQRLTIAQAMRVAWHRARAFNILSRVPLAGLLLAAWEWPIHLALVAKDGDRIRRWRTASLTVDDGQPTTRAVPVMAAAAATLGVFFFLVMCLGVAMALTLSPPLAPYPAGLVGVLIAASPTLLDFGSTVIERLVRHRESLTMIKRRTELAARGDVAVMSWLVRARGTNNKGDGAALIEEVKPEWEAREVAVILHPANIRLVSFYVDHGAVLDDNARQRMIYNYQARPDASSRHQQH